MLADIQAALESRYDVSVPYRVENFVLHDTEQFVELCGDVPTAPEVLLLQENDDNLDLTLFLDSCVMENASKVDWQADWSGNSFNDHCIVLEGVSHFLYLVWNAHYDRAVNVLELEVQAEVDKFVFSALMANETGLPIPQLLTRLFEQVSYREGLSDELKSRYESANHFAAQYCQWLSEEFKICTTNAELRAELARFYRLIGASKINRIRNLH